METDVTFADVAPIPTAVVATSTTWTEFPTRWRPMLDEVWSYLRSAPAGLYAGGHNVMLYKDDVPNVEVGVQVSRPFDGSGAVVASSLPGGPVATARHTGSMDRIGDTYAEVHRWCAANGYTLTGPRWEIYGDPDPATGLFAVEIFCSVRRP